jgi:hypothetical protein
VWEMGGTGDEAMGDFLNLKYVYFSLRGSMYRYTKFRRILVNPPEGFLKTLSNPQFNNGKLNLILTLG